MNSANNPKGKRPRNQRRTVGAIVKVDLGDGSHSYAQILKNSNFAFYDIRSKGEVTNPHELRSAPIAFVVSVYDDAVTKGRWQKVISLPLDPRVTVLPQKFIQDPMDPNRFEIYDPNTGQTRPAKRDECIGLERAAVWEARQVEERLREHFEGRASKWEAINRL